jgi:hypothetical protein
MDARTTFLDCPAYMNGDGTVRCGLPAVVEDSYTLGSTDGPVTSVKIHCPAGHWFSGPVSALTVHADAVHADTVHSDLEPSAPVAVPVRISTS